MRVPDGLRLSRVSLDAVGFEAHQIDAQRFVGTDGIAEHLTHAIEQQTAGERRRDASEQ